MNSTIYTSNMTQLYSELLKNSRKKGSQTEETTFLDKVAERSEASQTKKESVVDQYKKQHPDRAYTVDAQVQAGKAFKRKKGVADVSTEDMTMVEYKRFITWLLNSIPFDSTRIYDKEITSISEEGWGQMKNDPDYEAWVLGYTVQNRSVRNPFFGWPGASGSFYVEKFGASIEEHMGQSLGPTGPITSTSTNKKEKSWWEKRQERMKENMERQIEKAREKALAERAWAQETYHNELFASQQRLRGFLMRDVLSEQEEKNMAVFQPTELSALAAAAYEDVILTFSKKIIGGKH